MSDCEHRHRSPPPPGKHLPVCLDCCKRLIECSSCDAALTAGPHVADSGWTKQGWRQGSDVFRVMYCPDCGSRLR